MTTPSRLPKALLRKDLRRAIHAGAPWIFRDALALSEPPADGALVLVVGKDGRPLGRGFFSSSGAIAVRMLTTDRTEAVPDLFRARLERALAARRELFESKEKPAFRWVNGEGDRLPGLHVDVYAGYAQVLFDGSGARAFYLGLELVRVLTEVGSSLGLVAILERRRRGASEPGTATALEGSLPAGTVEVFEDGLAFEVDLAHGQKGGLFLDQRDNRRRVREIARGRRVLNLFGYTGGFSLHAALGGAAHTTTVDSARPAIEAAQRNFARNARALGSAARAAEFVVGDVFEFLAKARAAGTRYGLVISDPPSFAPSESTREKALAAYRRLHAACAAVVEPGGILCAASCSSHVGEDDFLLSVSEGVQGEGRVFELREIHGAASDHPVLPEFPEGRYLKFAIGALR